MGKTDASNPQEEILFRSVETPLALPRGGADHCRPPLYIRYDIIREKRKTTAKKETARRRPLSKERQNQTDSGPVEFQWIVQSGGTLL